MYKNLLITGGAGFIGSNFINYILEKYPESNVFNIDRLDYCSNHYYINQCNNYNFIQGDICDALLIFNILVKHNIECLVHFAAQSHVDNSFGNSIQFTIDNVLGTHTLLESSKNYGKLKKFIHISTDEVYGEVDILHEGCSEKSLLNPTNPYAASKAGAEFIVRSYYHSYKLPIIITRGNNVFGPNQYCEKLIPNFIDKLLHNKKCEVHGNGLTRRNFIYVTDVCSAIEHIILKGEINEIYNIGSTDEYSVMEILQMLVDKLKIDKPLNQVCVFVQDRPFNDFRYAIKTDNIEKLGWKKQIKFDEGLDQTIQHYIQKL